MDKRVAQKIVDNEYKKESKLIPVEFYTKSGVNKIKQVRVSCQTIESVLRREAFQTLGVYNYNR